MKTLKKIGLLIILVFAAALSVFFFWNSWFYARARNEDDLGKKIAFLEKSNNFCPLNDLVFYELGKAHLDLGLQSLGVQAEAESHFRKSVQGLERSITINPASPYAHFYLAQALLQLSVFSPTDEARSYEEFKKAARLAGDDNQVYGDVGRIFFSRWQKLSEGDRRFTLDLLRRIMARRDRDQIATILSIWELNVGDYSVMDSILPADPQIYRQYAEFLAEKSLSLPERHKFLAKAELIEFERARKALQAGEYALYQYRIPDARDHLGQALALLEGIRFYQTFLAQSMITDADYSDLLRSARLGLAKCRIEEGGKLEDAEDDLRRYLAIEDRPKEVAALETYLKGHGVLLEQSSTDFNDLHRLAFELLLEFKQTRYRDIISLGRTLQKSLVIVPEEKKKDYARVLRIIGDSFQKVDFIYDAGDSYRRALEIDPQPLDTLLRLREDYDRLNDERRTKDVENAISKLETPKAVEFGNSAILKGQAFSRTLTFDGEKVALDLNLNANQGIVAPIVSVFFNGRVIWEDILTRDVISLSLETKAGDNLFQIIPLNRGISLVKISWRPGESRPES